MTEYIKESAFVGIEQQKVLDVIAELSLKAKRQDLDLFVVRTALIVCVICAYIKAEKIISKRDPEDSLEMLMREVLGAIRHGETFK